MYHWGLPRSQNKLSDRGVEFDAQSAGALGAISRDNEDAAVRSTHCAQLV